MCAAVFCLTHIHQTKNLFRTKGKDRSHTPTTFIGLQCDFPGCQPVYFLAFMASIAGAGAAAAFLAFFTAFVAFMALDMVKRKGKGTRNMLDISQAAQTEKRNHFNNSINDTTPDMHPWS